MIQGGGRGRDARAADFFDEYAGAIDAIAYPRAVALCRAFLPTAGCKDSMIIAMGKGRATLG